jgi:hypothetical protein
MRSADRHGSVRRCVGLYVPLDRRADELRLFEMDELRLFELDVQRAPLRNIGTETWYTNSHVVCSRLH